MRYFLIAFIILLTFLGRNTSAQEIVAETLGNQTFNNTNLDDAYSPTRVLEQVAPNLPQEEMPAEFTETEPMAEPTPILEPEPIAPELIEAKKATLQILDKIDARVKEIEVELDKEKEHQELKIEVKRCVRSPQESKEENMAFIRIWDIAQGDYTNIIFSGWMFSSNPALHSFEHSIYDIVLLKCSD